ncbi:MAG TPA: TetR/AcrR family transcriptional regulator [Kiritimatiellia bacterium]|nr:TetR/AcrR family transcriptional regulator [Kiritimatiellia bacterium]HNR93417.1 TetR/AcrR family transcriptional regulator [Kiritimatiellia bacterium]HNS80785.1 TetR/AcrR family transcriptional regulator [Kiritimatiellia bacterium]HPA77124.1 TetR/AcrR family transcriptional regulator [Kiritimatiellia bacterium]HQQ03295.1 TetR/AcrR family transcriptional regulator [Kiritimatiellia bacterium]
MSIREEKKEAKRSAILAAAEGLFRARRYDEVTLDQVAKKARVGKGTIYLYFRNKEALFFQMVTEDFESMLKTVEQIAVSDRDIRRRLLDICSETSAFFTARFMFLQIMHHEEQFLRNRQMQSRLKKDRDRLRAALHRVFLDGIRNGVLRNDCPADVMEIALVGAMRFRNMSACETGAAIDLEAMIDLFLQGAAACNKKSKRTVL